MIYNFAYIIIFEIVASVQAFQYQYIEKYTGFNRSQITEIILNDSFDKNLPLIQNYIKESGMEPLQLPDHILTVTDLGVGKVHLQKGWIQNLIKIKRSGDVILRYNDKVFHYDLDLGWDNIYVNYDYTIRYFLLTRKGSFTGRFKNLRVRLLGMLDLQTHFLKLDFFKFVDINDFTLRLEGHLTDNLINVLTKVLTVFIKNQVLREIEYQSTLVIENKIKEINELKPDFIDNIIHSLLEILKNFKINSINNN